MSDEVEALRDELDRTRREADGYLEERAALDAEIAALREKNEEQAAEISALRKDAQRYRWLRSRKGLTIRPDGGWWTREDGSRFLAPYMLRADEVQFPGEESLDAAIDAVRRALEEEP